MNLIRMRCYQQGDIPMVKVLLHRQHQITNWAISLRDGIRTLAMSVQIC